VDGLPLGTFEGTTLGFGLGEVDVGFSVGN